MRKAIRVLSIAVLAVTLGYMIFKLGLIHWAVQTGSGSVGIIGGADGPTAIFVAGSPASTARMLLPALGIALPIVGIVLTRKK